MGTRMRQTSESEIEDIITSRLRRDDPDIERISIREEGVGWRCHWIWLANDAPRLTMEEWNTVLDKANLILVDLLKDCTIVKRRKRTR